jgi:hypothetical protein
MHSLEVDVLVSKRKHAMIHFGKQQERVALLTFGRSCCEKRRAGSHLRIYGGKVSPMKIVLFVLLCSPAYGSTCLTGQPKDEATLVQIEHTWVRAVEQHDVATLACILADEFEEADFDGSLISRGTMLANATKPGNGHDELEDLHAHIYGEVAYVRGIGVHIENGRLAGKTRFTDIFVFRDGRWQCVAGHDSRFPEAQ